jgi:hypothetical protein
VLEKKMQLFSLASLYKLKGGGETSQVLSRQLSWNLLLNRIVQQMLLKDISAVIEKICHNTVAFSSEGTFEPVISFVEIDSERTTVLSVLLARCKNFAVATSSLSLMQGL